MAIGVITVADRVSHDRVTPFFDRISFPGEASYVTGGSVGFTAAVRAILARGNVEIIAVLPGDCGGYVPVYVPGTDALKVYYGDNNNASDGPLVEVPAATVLTGTTFNLVVVGK